MERCKVAFCLAIRLFLLALVALPAFAGANEVFLLLHRSIGTEATDLAELSSQKRTGKAAPGKVTPGKATPQKPQAPKQAAPKDKIPPRIPFSAEDQARATIPGMPDARFWADSPAAFRAALPKTASDNPGPWLVLSTGGEDGAYGAGLLAGWGAAATRPDFAVITGVSTGALMAPFVFAGTKYDEDLRKAYTTLTAADVFEIGGRRESLLDSWPLKDLIVRLVNEKLVADIAAEHERGRRLFALTTNLDAGRPVAWDIGAIARHRNPQALALIRNILYAASSIPGAFPPVLIEAETDGRRFQEMHVDGGLGAQFYVAPDILQASTSTFRLPASELFVVINMKLAHDFQLTERSLDSILSRAIAAAIRVVTANAIDRAYQLAQRSHVPFHLAFIDAGFAAPKRGSFDPDYMKALFEFGYGQGRDGTAFHNAPPQMAEPSSATGPQIRP